MSRLALYVVIGLAVAGIALIAYGLCEECEAAKEVGEELVELAVGAAT